MSDKCSFYFVYMDKEVVVWQDSCEGLPHQVIGDMPFQMEWLKKCPMCGKEILYKGERNYELESTFNKPHVYRYASGINIGSYLD